MRVCKHDLDFGRQRETALAGLPDTRRCAGGHTANNGLKVVFILCHYAGSQIVLVPGRKQRELREAEGPSKEPKRTHLHPGLHSGLRQGRC